MNILISIFAVGLLIALHEGGHFFAARRMGMRVLRASVGLLTGIVKWTSPKSGTIYQVGVLPFGGFVQIKGMNPFEEGAFEDDDSYQTKSTWRRGLVIVAGPLVNLLVAWLLLFGLYTAGNPEFVDEAGVGDVVSGGPADQAGLKTGDRILTFEGEALETWDDLVSRLRPSPGKQVMLGIEREGKKMSIPVTPADVGGIGKIGIGQPRRNVSLPVHVAAAAAAIRCGQVVVGTLVAISQAVTGSGGAVETVGPVGIVKMAATTLDTGFKEFLALVSYLSLMLFLFNLLPLPALDGGRAVFLLFELVTRRRVNPRVDATVSMIGFVILMLLIGLMVFKDIFGS